MFQNSKDQNSTVHWEFQASILCITWDIFLKYLLTDKWISKRMNKYRAIDINIKWEYSAINDTVMVPGILHRKPMFKSMWGFKEGSWRRWCLAWVLDTNPRLELFSDSKHIFWTSTSNESLTHYNSVELLFSLVFS